MNVIEFIEARLDEERQKIKEAQKPDSCGETRHYYNDYGPYRDDWGVYTFGVPLQNLIADNESDRALLNLFQVPDPCDLNVSACIECKALYIMARRWKSHADFKKEWA